MTQSRIGYHIAGNTAIDRAYLVQHHQDYHPTTALVLENGDLAAQLHVVTNGETKVGHRNYHPNEGAEWQGVSPQQWAVAQMAWGHPEIFRQVLNEPAWDGSHRLIDLNHWLYEVGGFLATRDYGAILGNYAVGTTQQADIDAGAYDDLLRIVSAHPGKLYIGVHEYCLASMPFGFGFWAPDALLNVLQQDPSQWMKTLPATGGRWWLGREQWLIDRARKLQLNPLPQFWVSEWGWDEVEVRNSQGQNLKDLLIQRWGVGDGYKAIRGIHGLEKIWQGYWGALGWTKERAAYEQMIYADTIYPPEVIGFNLYTWSAAPDWVQAGSSIADLGVLHTLLKNYHPMPPQPQPLPVPPPIAVPPVVTPPPVPTPPPTAPMWRGVVVSPEMAGVFDALLAWGSHLRSAT